MIKTSAYLDGILRSTAVVHNDLGLDLVSDGRFDEAVAQFEEALSLQPEFAAARHNLTVARQVHGASTNGAGIAR